MDIENQYENTVLSKREVQVWLLREKDNSSRTETANKLDLSKNTIDEFYRRAKKKREKAKNTLELMKKTE